MIPQKQLFRHRPELGEIGDCHRTAIACLLNKSPDKVPHFGELDWDPATGEFRQDGNFNQLVDDYLKSQGLAQIHIAYQDELETVLRCQEVQNPSCYYLLGGQSRAGVNHTVIGLGGGICWDPSLDDTGITGPCQPDGLYWVTFLVPINLTTMEPAYSESIRSGLRFREMTLTSKTLWSDTGEIKQELDIMGQVTKRVLDTQEVQVRQALIAMGWVPPTSGVPPTGRKQ